MIVKRTERIPNKIPVCRFRIYWKNISQNCKIVFLRSARKGMQLLQWRKLPEMNDLVIGKAMTPTMWLSVLWRRVRSRPADWQQTERKTTGFRGLFWCSKFFSQSMSMSGSPQHQLKGRQIPKRVALNELSQLPHDYSTTPGGSIFSTTPGGLLTLFIHSRTQCLY